MGENWKMGKRWKRMVCGCTAVFMAFGICMNVHEPLSCKAENKMQVESAQGLASERLLNVGSVSKVYTVTAVMQLVDQGKVNLDAPVTDYITDFKLADERYQKITVRMLMNHTSGLMGSVYGEIFHLGDGNSEYHDAFLGILQKE